MAKQEEQTMSLRVGEDGFYCPHCKRPGILQPSRIKPVSFDPDDGTMILDIAATCPTQDGGCGNSLGFVVQTLGSHQ